MCVLFGNGTVETILCRHGKRKAVDEKFTFLFVTLGSVTFQAVGNITEIGFPVASVGKSAGKFVFFVTAEIEFGFVVGTQQIGVYLFADYLIGDGEFGPSFIRAANGEHTEIVEQAHKVVGVGNIDGRKTFFQFSGDVAFAHQCLYDGGIMGKLFVLPDEHT